MFYAHSENPQGKKHSLGDHLTATASLARSFAPSRDLEALFYLAGLMHDIGKFQDAFQRYLQTKGESRHTPHAGIGACIAKILAKQHVHLQFAIQGHHAGMPNNEERRGNNDEYGKEKDLVDEVTSRFYAAVSKSQNLSAPPDLPNQRDPLLAECTTRLLFSALADADWLDTERHFNLDISEARASLALDCDRLLALLDSKYSAFPKEGLINELRTKARMEVAELACDETGFFSLQLPTGLGKTLTSVYWALLHARHNHLRRIIIVLPYLNIIDQTAKILKELFGESTVLEHHSGIVDDEKERDRYSEDAVGVDNDLARRLACENWDSPIIVTTTVQFFESLFSNRPFRSRKNHNIARSVVVFDEVQTLPKEYAEPIIVMLKNLNALTSSSFLFCTATQPAFTKRDGFDGIGEIRPLIKKPQRYFIVTRRVKYKLLNHLDEIPLDQLMRSIAEERDSFLIVVNTKSVARDLFQRIASYGKHERYYHLSTAMCPHHRKTKIGEILDDLETRKRIAVVSTQLVEAGVDFDFPCVYRAIGPLDSVIQAAGRCNRNGLLHGKGRVVLFNLEQHRMPDRTYQACAMLAKGLIQDDPSLLHRSESFKRYYEQVLRLFVNADKYGINDERGRFNFKNVAESFRMIDEQTASLLIKDYSAESGLLADELANRLEFGKMSRDQYRKAQQFSVQVYPKFLKEYGAQIEIVKDTLRIWHGNYSNDTGLAPQDVETVF
jgi:CRISPR-associated endonuclease/helicase Cas3